MRADARRNRARVLEVAVEVFATEGLSVPIHEIARRAGVGTGTVSRHFPTKEALYQAIVLDVTKRLVDKAGTLAAAEDPGAAFFEFFAVLARTGADNRGLAEALAGAGFDVESAAAAADSDQDLIGAIRGLLVRAQQAGAVRPDVQAADVKALLVGCHARSGDPATLDRMIAIATTGLRPPRT
jgi:AcrR family transcriptional regulator